MKPSNRAGRQRVYWHYYDRTSSGYEVVNPITHERCSLPNQTGQPGAWSPDGEYYLAPEMSYLQAAGKLKRE